MPLGERNAPMAFPALGAVPKNREDSPREVIFLMQ